MAEKHVVVQGAECMCKFGTSPDKLKVLKNSKEFVNDKNATKKSIASTVDLGATFEKNMFGSCSKLNNKPCNAVVSEWSNYYQDIILKNGGKILLEDSKGTCPIGGKDCISIVQHGQKAEPSDENKKNADENVQSQLNPMDIPDELSTTSQEEVIDA
ncbi:MULTISPECIES: DUF4280 domain-containing protein [unclassified Sphingobacterium]|uniref:DUF4280 domain-containing protein n=1 Tax=unclassified Sphingobacterium TaxID=2609468 RepID=UPI001AE36714|nr:MULTISPECIES: DUF4280 domain-containing protein [unclassified Sphingobacterium]MDR6733551.1 hypothetical protein [Sphingobacterium sp. 2149]